MAWLFSSGVIGNMSDFGSGVLGSKPKGKTYGSISVVEARQFVELLARVRTSYLPLVATYSSMDLE